MNVAFRVDASDKIGTGSLMRCLTLAEALRNEGARVQFFCRKHPGNLIELLKLRSMPVTALPAPEKSNDISDNDGYASWLGVSQEEDAEQVINLLASIQPQWLVVDHYGIDEVWEQRLLPHAHEIMVIDDLANRRHKCSLLLDQNYTSTARYRSLISNQCKVMLGPKFAMLRPQYYSQRGICGPRSGTINRVLVYFGGSDLENISSKAMQALSSTSHSHLIVDIVIGSNNKHRETLETQASNRSRTFIHQSLDHLAGLMAHADIAIGAGGATTWERLCLGLPTLVVTCADNQVPLAQILDKKGLIRLIGNSCSVTAGDIHDAIKLEITTPTLYSNSSIAMQMCDGTGTARVVAQMRDYFV